MKICFVVVKDSEQRKQGHRQREVQGLYFRSLLLVLRGHGRQLRFARGGKHRISMYVYMCVYKNNVNLVGCWITRIYLLVGLQFENNLYDY